jgi:RNA polymerase sigma-70 factor (ECF subfamily)
LAFFKTNRKSKKALFEDMIIDKEKELYRLAYYYVKNEADALDILQESIVKAFTKLNKLNEIEALEKWIKKIIINTAIDFIRKNSKVMLVEEDTIMNLCTTKDSTMEIACYIDGLEEELKSIIILKYFHGYTINEVAEILDLSVSQVKNKLHKALELLRVDWKEGHYGHAVL